MIAAALTYASRGWHVFPVAPDCRSPTIDGGCRSASADSAILTAWWSQRPSANLSLACGPLSGVLALDIDRKGTVDGFAALDDLQAEFGTLPKTVRSRTPSGGRHLLFRFPIGVSPANRVGLKRYSPDGSRRVYAGLDVRADGASICLPPSRRPDGAYRWEASPDDVDLAPVPRWLLALMLSEPPARPPGPPLRMSSVDKAARYISAAVDRECASLAAMGPNSGRNLRLFQAAANLGELVGGGLLPQSLAEAALEQAAGECGLVREDGLGSVRASIASGMRRGLAKPRGVAA
jgi:hypothetical protein